MLPDQERKKKKGLEAARSQNAVASVAKMRGTEFDKHKCSVRYLRCHTFVEIKSYENEGKKRYPEIQYHQLKCLENFLVSQLE